MNLDQSILVAINQGLANPWADFLFDWISSRISFALPLLLVVLWLLIHHYGREGAKLWSLLLLLVLLGDVLGGQIKEMVHQYRPCADFYQALQFGSESTGPCIDNTKGMPSNHALNYFTVVAYLFVTTRRRLMGVALTLVAVLVGVSRIYLAKHYPSQVLAGAMLGLVWGAGAGWLGLHYLHFVRQVREQRDG